MFASFAEHVEEALVAGGALVGPEDSAAADAAVNCCRARYRRGGVEFAVEANRVVAPDLRMDAFALGVGAESERAIDVRRKGRGAAADPV